MTPAALTALMQQGLRLTADWGIEVLSAADGRAVLRLPPNPALWRPGPTLSGPALMGLADVAIWAAVMASGAQEGDALTANLSIHFLRPAGTAAVLAEARLVREGRRSVYAEVWLRAEHDERPCAHVTSGWLRTGS